MRDALSLALELESYQLASRQRTKLVRGTHLEEGPTQPEQSTVASSADISGNKGQKKTFDTLGQENKFKLIRRILTLIPTSL